MAAGPFAKFLSLFCTHKGSLEFHSGYKGNAAAAAAAVAAAAAAVAAAVLAEEGVQ